MKKLYNYLIVTLVSIILTNALLSNVVMAADKQDPFLDYTNTNHNGIFTGDSIDKYGEEGTASGSSNETRPVNTVNNGTNLIPVSEQHDRDTNLQSEQSSFIGSQLASIVKLIPRLLQILMSQCVGVGAATSDMFTIQNLLMGKYDLFDINIFVTSSSTSTATQGQAESNFNVVIKESVASWYGTIRTLAIILSLIILLYSGIRMAASTTVADRVRYKKILTAWIVGFALIFVLHYIVLVLITVSNQLVKVLTALAPVETTQFEIAVLQRIESAKASGWNLFLQAILYAMLVWYQAKFFFMYLKRVISNAFLILIAPLVTVTYAVDKSNDCKAQAFNAWLEEFITNTFIQPMHLVLFLVLLYSAGAIAELYPIIAILFMFGIGKAEQVLRGLFKLRGSSVSGTTDGTSFTSLVAKF